MKHLNINDIISNHEKRAEKRKESFNKVLEMCYKKIDKSSKLDNIACFFDVPEFLVGFPLFSLNECIMYVYNHLVKNGFTVQYIFPRILYISWLTPQYIHHVKQLTEPNPQSTHALLMAPATDLPNIGIAKQVSPPHGNKSPTRARTLPQRRTPVPKKTVQGKSIAEFKANGRCVLNLN